jgi:hypothetical protein
MSTLKLHAASCARVTFRECHGGGSIPFDATNGNYVINFFARADSTEPTLAGTYVIEALAIPPLPAIDFEARPTDVPAGSTVRLEWSSQNATSCTASGGGWTGAKGTSGDENSPVINAATTFTNYLRRARRLEPEIGYRECRRQQLEWRRRRTLRSDRAAVARST